MYLFISVVDLYLINVLIDLLIINNNGYYFRWRGSVYKLVWRELAAYLVLYFAINLAYRFAFTEAQQKYVKLLKNNIIINSIAFFLNARLKILELFMFKI